MKPAPTPSASMTAADEQPGRKPIDREAGLLAQAREFQLLGEPIMSLLQGLPWPAILVDECGFVILVNAAMREHRRSDDPGGPSALRDRFPEYHAALRGNPPWLRPQEANVTRESEGRVVHERLIVRAMPGGACILVEDLTRTRELEATDAQTARLASLGFMLAGACHEISNPLAAIYSMVQLLRANPQADRPEVQKGLAHIGHNVHRLLEISQRLSGFSRVGDEPRAVFPVDESVEESLVLLRQCDLLDEVEVVREFDPEAHVLGNPGQLREVFHNIILNALQAMQGRGRLLVRTSRPAPGELEVGVHDSGPGVPPKSLARIFEPFFTTKPNGKGTGLGLSISNEIVHQHGGRIRVENDPQGGAWFFVALPLAERHP